MTNKIYKSAQGKVVDVGALLLQNEGVRAVGNMGVNARGDRVNNQNQSIDSRSEQLKRQYKKQVSSGNAKDDQVVVSAKRARETPSDEPTVQEEEVVEQTVQAEVSESEGGLAAAIARARQIKQEPLKTPRQLAQEKEGVTKI